MDKFEDAELIQSFVSECHDMMDDVEPIFIQLQAQPATEDADIESINAIFRLFHSMKGSASFLSFNNISEITHKAETFLDLFRHKKVNLTPYYIDVQLKTVDAIREILDQVSETLTDEGFENLRDTITSELEKAITMAKSGDSAPQPESPPPPEIPPPASKEKPAEPPKEKEKQETKPALNKPKTELAEEDFPEFTITAEMATRFAQESSEIIENAEQCLLDLEKSDDDDDQANLLNEAFRYIHSFKGNCGFMQLNDMENLSHRMETVLDLMRNGESESSEQNFDILLQVIDTLRESLNDFSEGGTGSIPNCDVMIEFLGELMPPESESDEGQSKEEEVLIKSPTPPPQATKEEKEEPKVTPTAQAKPILPQPAPATPTEVVKQPTAVPVKKEKKERPKTVRRDIRVDIDKLDALINLVGELVIAEAMVLRHPAILGLEDESLERSIHHLKRISSDLQDVAMSVRMIPLAGTFKKMIRLVHDISRKSGKKANIKLIGEDTEVDKNVIEQISDPLVHIIRNSVDHGIEPPAERETIGKDPTGTVILEAKHEGGEVWITIKDDGKGLNRERILAKAIDRGIIPPSSAEDLSDNEAYNLIFQPGFSTAEQVSDLSGRGVGMDVVKKNIEKLNGKVSVHSTPNQGTDIILHIPLTLAIIDGMLVRVGNAQYTIPLLAIRESIAKPSLDNVTVTPDGQETILIRGELIPILRLYKLFDKNTEITEINEGILVVVESDKEILALLVDELLGQQETVIKGLSSYLKNPKGISGCTVLGNGEVSLIIDVAGLIKSESNKQV